MQAQDQSQQQRANRVVQEMLAQIVNKPRVFQEVADLYIAKYRSLTSIDLFSDDGHPTGRAAAAARTVAEQFKGQQRAGMVRAILDDLRDMAREIDRQFSA